MKINCAYDKIVETHTIQENPKNSNKHPQKQIDILAKIIDYQGQRSPIVVSNRSGFIVKGHGRLQAIKKLGWQKCAVDFQDYDSEAQEYADMIADNKIAELSDHDDSLFINELKLNVDIDNFDFNLLGLPDLKIFFNEMQKDNDQEEKDKSSQEKKYIIEVQFPNDMEMMDVHDELCSQGYLVKIK